jgi:hypothetical protein
MKLFLLPILCSVLAMAGMPAAPNPSKEKTIPAGGLAVSNEARDLIVYYECGGQGYYNSKLKTPTWPGGASGVTIGIGYDLGYNSKAQIAADWSHIDSTRVARLQSVAGLKGQTAKLALGRAKGVVISWEEALVVFDKKTIPRFGKDTYNTFPKLSAEHPHGQGAMMSIVFNRGSSLSGGTRLEMRQIRDALVAGKSHQVPDLIRAMRRLWVGKNLPGLLKRRVAEAALYEKGRAAR